VLVITHDTASLHRFDRVLRLESGRVLAAEPVAV